jgi:hypothetical protein
VIPQSLAAFAGFSDRTADVTMSLETKLKMLGVMPKILPSEESLRRLERDHIGASLPDGYREFLKTYNGCQFTTIVYYSSLETLYPQVRATEGTVNSLYGLYENDNRQGLLYSLACFAEDMAKGCIPIGADLFGNQICIGAVGLRRGMIHFWDHEVDLDTGDPPTIERLPIIADSFADFIESLYTKPE